MTVAVHVRDYCGAPTDTGNIRARGRRDEHALYVLEGIRGAVVQVNGGRATVDAHYDVRRTITIKIGDEAAHGTIPKVRRDALKRPELDPGADDQGGGR
jgi:hypothetical protein